MVLKKVYNKLNGKSGDALPRVFIHCGTYKTGSSSIQNFLFNNRTEHLSKGILFPKTGLMLDKPEVGQRHWYFVYKFNERSIWDDLFVKLMDEIKTSQCHTVILSAEAWSRVSSLDSLKELTARLKRSGFEVFGIMYLRNRFDYGRALYREVSRRWGNTESFEQYVSQDFNKKTIDLTELVTGFKSIFEDKSIFRDYAKIDDVLSDFNHIAGIDYNKDLRVKVPRQNTSWSAVDAEIQRLKNVGYDNQAVAKIAKKIPNWIKESVTEVYPDDFFSEADESFTYNTGFSEQQTKAILYGDELKNLHDIKSLSGLFTSMLNKQKDKPE